MKKFLVCLMILLIVVQSGCSGRRDFEKRSQIEVMLENMRMESDVIEPGEETGGIEDYEEEFYYMTYDKDLIEQYEEDAIPNIRVAAEMATAIFKEVAKEAYESGAVLRGVGYDPDKRLWVVTFLGEVPPNSYCMIVMQQKDGKVLNISFGG